MGDVHGTNELFSVNTNFIDTGIMVFMAFEFIISDC